MLLLIENIFDQASCYCFILCVMHCIFSKKNVSEIYIFVPYIIDTMVTYPHPIYPTHYSRTNYKQYMFYIRYIPNYSAKKNLFSNVFVAILCISLFGYSGGQRVNYIIYCLNSICLTIFIHYNQYISSWIFSICQYMVCI